VKSDNGMSARTQKTHKEVVATASLWQKISYQSKLAEFILYILVISGLLLWDGFGLPWEVTRPSLVVHFIISLILFPVLVLPFWLSHRELLKKSKKRFLSKSGQIIEYIFIALFVSGLYLTFFGNRGDLLGNVAYWMHLLPSIPVVILVYMHAKRWSMLKALKWLAALVVALCALSLTAFAATESTGFTLNAKGDVLYSANGDTGTISWIEKETGNLLGDVKIGGDIRRLALGPDGMIAANDYTGHRVVFVKDKIVAEYKVPYRPFGIVYDKRNDLYWVAAFEGHRLLAVHPDKGIVYDLETAETPRGLALLSDGRLLVSHAMIGEISIYDTTQLPPVKTASIKLHETQNKDEFVSQGVPRLLDDIAISPDETEAWLPHVLWNFDHPFQFQSTIFPSVSLLSLKKGEEKELVKRRKHLFKQINIVETSKRTRIVSNPHDAAFSADGKKVYITLSASEDLMVFDLSRRTDTKKKKKRRARRKGKINQGGAKAQQIYRHLPGDTPRGIVVSDQDIYVQNAMSLDITKMSRGGTGPFARAKLVEPSFAKLIEKDPMLAAQRRGKTLFMSGNTTEDKDYPIAGDFWMSCQSCHVDGFNFTTGYLFRDSKVEKYENARIGHQKLGTMIAGDFAQDYVRIIRDTQGGMGGDLRDGATDVDPEKMPNSVQQKMNELHTFVLSQGNLPLLSPWLRLDDERKTVHEEEWVNSAVCAECHSDMFDQWADSLHRLMGESNPYFKVVEEVAAQTEGEDFRKWCLGCHHPQGLLSGYSTTTGQGHMFEKGGKSLFKAQEEKKPDLDEGTGCLFCHRITKLESAMGKKAGGNASFTVNVKDRELYVFENSKNDLLNWAGNHQINAKPEVHAQSYSQPFYKDSALCSTCHNEFAPGTGSVIVNTYGEWEQSEYNNPEDPSKHRSCIDCHMHGDIKRIGEKIPGISTDGGKVKDNVVTHQFTGANHHLVGLRNEKLAKMSVELLQSAARLENSINVDGKLNVRVKNVGAGHALPTGVADFRQLWLDITLKDANGNVVLAEGKMDEKGNVAKDARFFQKVFGDKDGNPVGLLFWRYEKMLKDTKIPANGYRDEQFELPENVIYPLSVETKLMFRIYPQWVTDAVREKYPELPNPDAVIMTELTSVLERP